MVKFIESITFNRDNLALSVRVSVVGLSTGYFVFVEMVFGDKWTIVETHEFTSGKFAEITGEVVSAHDLVWLKIAKEEGLL